MFIKKLLFFLFYHKPCAISTTRATAKRGNEATASLTIEKIDEMV